MLIRVRSHLRKGSLTPSLVILLTKTTSKLVGQTLWSQKSQNEGSLYKAINPTVKAGRERKDRMKFVLIKVWKFPPAYFKSTLGWSDHNQGVLGAVWETDIAKYLDKLVIP